MNDFGNTVDGESAVTILGAGHIDFPIFESVLRHAPKVIAADGGAVHALKMGKTPIAVVGDFDSIDQDTIAALPPHTIHHVKEQETTDFDKCLDFTSAEFILAVGFTGGRLDHELAAFSTLVKNAHRSIILVGPKDIVFVAPQNLQISLTPGTRFSLFPMGEVSGRSLGLRWKIDGLSFAPDRRIGTSNEVVDSEVSLTLSNTKMLAILPQECLPNAIKALVPAFQAPC